MQPNLSLMYAGGGVNGPVGHGWSVQGVSMITRCPATRQTDGMPRGVTFTSTDKLCLDGQRLIQTDANGGVTPVATYDANGKLVSFPQIDDARGLSSGYREYRTEKDSFARIRAYGTTGASDANGPLYFKVWTKAGQIYEYGAPPSADANTKAAVVAQGKTVIMVWAVARVSDVVGNYIDFKYEVRSNVLWGSGPTAGSPTPGQEANIAEIQYTGNINNSQVPANKVIFRYADRVLDRSEAYQQGAKSVSVRLLQGIDTYINSTNTSTLGAVGAVAVKTYKLSYDNGPVTRRSRVKSIQECGGPASSTLCLPPVIFNYADGSADTYVANGAFAGSPVATLAMQSTTGNYGVIPADFNGDGKTDFVRWSDTPAQNELYLSNGDGTFVKAPTFNLLGVNLSKSDACYVSLIADVNGDGLPDIMRHSAQTVASGAACTAYGPTLVYTNNGDGTFTPKVYSGPTLRRDPGANFYLLDFDGDGRVDLVTTIAGVVVTYTCPPGRKCIQRIPGYKCVDASGICTHVYRGNGDGTFSEVATNIGATSVYGEPRSNADLNAASRVADLDGDGLPDLVGWAQFESYSVPSVRSVGDGNFERYAASACTSAIDFNGDGRADCLLPSSSNPASNAIYMDDGAGSFSQAGNFNLINVGQELVTPAVSGSIVTGFRVLDVNGDGREDILRWKDDPTQTALYLSNGDGTFTASPAFASLFGSAANQLKKSDGTSEFIIGDFTGRGAIEILRLKASPVAGAATSNQLYVKADATRPDQLISVVSPTGLKTTLTYGSLAALAPPASALSTDLPLYRYYSDRRAGSPATYPVVDLTPTLPVVVTSEAEIGVGTNTVKTEYAYRGMKATVDGRGMLGFRQSVQQNTASNGDALAVFTDYLLDEPYAGTARRTETRKGIWSNPSAQLLSWTTNTYCDRTSAANPDSATDVAPCATNARLKRPYLRKSVEEGLDLGGNPLPKVTTVNTYDDYLNATNVAVTTEASFAGANRQYINANTNIFCAPDTAGCPNKVTADNWILGRVTSSTVTSTVPNLLPSLTASVGNAPNAAAASGNQVVNVPLSPAVLAAILQLLLLD
jgi:hypothetical protein